METKISKSARTMLEEHGNRHLPSDIEEGLVERITKSHGTLRVVFGSDDVEWHYRGYAIKVSDWAYRNYRVSGRHYETLADAKAFIDQVS